jgi:hypothetical protein
MDLQLSERRIDELVAAFAVFGDRLTEVRELNVSDCRGNLSARI